jgi:hypothetical protein
MDDILRKQVENLFPPTPGFGEIIRAKYPQPTETIIAAAILAEGVTISLPQPARHGQVLHAAEAMGLPEYHLHSACQGFLTSTGRFVNRVMAKHIAHLAKQEQLRPESERHARDLFSEDLW